MPATKKKVETKRLKRFLASPQGRRLTPLLVAVLLFSSVGVYKLAFSSAATYRNNCTSRFLKLRDRGKCVEYLQDALNRSGGQPTLGIDGSFGSTTESSVVFIKQYNGWGDADGYGVAGPDFAARMCAGAVPINYCIR